MRHTTMLLLAWAALAGGAAVAAPQVKTDANDSLQRVDELIGKLGSAKFTDRDRATRELEILGPKALKQLRAAVLSGDAEIRFRASLLVRKIEDQQLTAALLAPKRVHLSVKNVSVAEAVAELAKQSGYPIKLVGNVASLTNQKITLDTGDTTFWDALEQLSAKGGLVETMTNPVQDELLKKMEKKAGGPAGFADPSSGIQLTAGDPPDSPVLHLGSVRPRLIEAKTKNNDVSGEVEVILEVNAEPRLEGFGSAGQPRVLKAVDGQGQMLAVLPQPIAEQFEFGGFVNGNGNFRGNGNVVMVNGNVVSSMGGPLLHGGPFQVKLRLAPAARPAKVLKELSGTLIVQTVVDAEPRVIVDKILQAAGQSAKGKDGTILHVRSVEKMTGGDVHIEIGLETAPGQGMGGLGGGANVVIIQGGGNVQINGNNINGGGNAGSTAGMPRLLDAAGKSFTLVQQTSPSVTIANGQVTQNITLVYRPQVGQGAPAQLVLPGQRVFTFEVPFKLQNVVIR
jgi:hypothetical protein